MVKHNFFKKVSIFPSIILKVHHCSQIIIFVLKVKGIKYAFIKWKKQMNFFVLLDFTS